jgi:hypothetical protein
MEGLTGAEICDVARRGIFRLIEEQGGSIAGHLDKVLGETKPRTDPVQLK